MNAGLANAGTEPAGAQAIRCAVCQAPAPATARFCSNCGNPLRVPSAAAAPVVAAAAPVVAEAAPAPAGPATAVPAATVVSGTERRRVTVLFGDLTDFTGWAEDLDPERVGAVTDRVLAACTAAVLDHGGTVDKLTGDGIMAVFGAPTAHEDDAERAVAAALAMQADVRAAVTEALGDIPEGRLGLRVGLNTGVVLAGVQAGMSYTVVGDAVNTASRLSDAARVGMILAGRETALATMHMASWRALPALSLKGKRGVVASYELVELRGPLLQGGAPGEEAPLVGRDSELGELIGIAAETIEGERPRSVVLTGEAGAGKTRLLVELSRFAGELPEGRVLWGRCAPYGVGRELAPIVEIIRAGLGVTDLVPTELSELSERLRGAIDALEATAERPVALPGLGDRLLSLLGASPLPDGAPGVLGSAARREHPRLDDELDAAATVLRLLAANGPLVLVIDDLHWALPQLQEALTDIAGRLTGPVLIAAAGRFEAAGETDRWWQSLPAERTIAVPPLPDDAVEELLRSHLGGAAVGPQVRALLLGRAQGNPFYLEELLHLLIEQGYLQRDHQGSWVIEGALPAELLPVGVQALISARLDVLDARSKILLRHAAVLGTRVPMSALHALVELSVDDVDEGVRTLVSRRLLVPLDGPEPQSYTFGHALTRDVAYAAVPKGERALLHADAARWFADTAGPAGDRAVATHADRAIVLATEMALPASSPAWRVRETGARAYDRLAGAAVARDDHRGAGRLYQRAVELGRPVLPAAEVAGVSVRWAAELSASFALDAAEAALVEPLASPDPELSSRARVVQGDVMRKRGDEAGATRAWVSAFAVASEAGLDGVAGDAIRNLGLQDYFAGRLSAAEERFRQALELARRVGDLRGSGWALQNLAWSRTSRGDFDSADATLAEAVTVFAGLGDVGGLSWCAGTEALVRVLQGRHTECRNLIASMLPMAEELGDPWGIAACLTIDALAAAELGDPELGRSRALQAAHAFDEVGDPWGKVLALATLGISLRGLGRLEESAGVLHEAVQTAVDITAPLTEIIALVALGQVALDSGDVGRAQRISEDAQILLTQIELDPGAWIAAIVLQGQVLRAQGDLAGALGLLEHAAAADHRDVVLFPQRQTLAHLSGVRLAMGDVVGARSAVELALVTPAEDVRSRVIALRALGSVRLAEGDGRGARGAWQEAMAVAQSSGQVSERAATRRLLDSV